MLLTLLKRQLLTMLLTLLRMLQLCQPLSTVFLVFKESLGYQLLLVKSSTLPWGSRVWRVRCSL